MKKGILFILGSAFTLSLLLGGCGNTPAPKAEATEETTTEVVEDTEASMEEIEKESEEENTTEEADTKETSEGFIKNYDFQWGTVDIYENPSNETLNDYDVYSTYMNGNELYFTFSGPKDLENLDEEYCENEDPDYVIRLKAENPFPYFMAACYEQVDDAAFDSYLNLSKEDWIDSIMADYIPEGYYDYSTTETTIKVILESEMPESDIKGYTCILIDKDSGGVYEICYFDKSSAYDSAVVLEIMNSIKIGEENFH